MHLFTGRTDAGEKLAAKLKKYRGKAVVVVAIPRGGLEVGRVVSDALRCPLDCVFSKKVPLPFEEEVAIGAVTLNCQVVGQGVIAAYGVEPSYVALKVKELREKMAQLDADYHAAVGRVSLAGKTVILVDDGVATGETMQAAVLELKLKKAGKIIIAVPVASVEALKKLEKQVDGVVCLSTPAFFMAISQFYKSFPQLSHEEAKHLLENAPRGGGRK